MQEIKFLYKNITIREMAIAISFTFGFSVFMAYMATSNEKGLSYKNIITLSKDNATIFYWCITGFMIFSTLYLISMVFKTLSIGKTDRYIVLNDRTISIPKNAVSNEIITVRYSDIKSIKSHIIQKKFLGIYIYYGGGQIFVNKSTVSENDFNQICTILAHMTKPKA